MMDTDEPMERDTDKLARDTDQDAAALSRRGFLKLAGTVVLVSSIGVAAGCETTGPAPAEPSAPVTERMPGMDNLYPEVPMDPMIPPSADVLQVFSAHEAQTVEALTARILPGTPDDPGAREAGVVTYIDNMLAFNEGFDEPTYRHAPFAEVYEGDQPPVGSAGQASYQVVYVSKDEIDRYGFQSIMSPRESYRVGLIALDNYARSKFNASFADLSADQQDQIVDDLSNDKADTFTHPSAPDFFDMVRNDTINGMFSDPGYGGNRDMAGWKLIGYPGAQRAYTEHDIRTEGNVRAPQSLAQMQGAHGGQPANPHVILPQSGDRSSESATMPAPISSLKLP